MLTGNPELMLFPGDMPVLDAEHLAPAAACLERAIMRSWMCAPNFLCPGPFIIEYASRSAASSLCRYGRPFRFLLRLDGGESAAAAISMCSCPRPKPQAPVSRWTCVSQLRGAEGQLQSALQLRSDSPLPGHSDTANLRCLREMEGRQYAGIGSSDAGNFSCFAR
jgi:hypothetical protein